ncbi:MAG: sulfurtransferase complex subunit TusD [Gammaproteobacteria bacterium]|nr:sulfurtransferase complex subunit TusD [Gammaproteobacteria bacterium]MDH5630680.1 sulfurtransferase complex subunit TusD [Gammaproteobacteria bacterium]
MAPIPITILVSGSPTNSQAHLSAQRFVQTAIASGHSIVQVFFSQEAVLVANPQTEKPTDEAQLAQNWQLLAKENKFSLDVCVSSAERRGIAAFCETVADDGIHHSTDGKFRIAGLAHLAAGMNQQPYKLIHFK